MTGATEGVCRPLQSRVEQILASETSPVTLYRTTNLIRCRIGVYIHEAPTTARFYASTLSSVVRKDGGLAASLAELTRLAHTQFVSSLQNRSEPCLVTSLSSSTSVSH